MRTKTYRKKLMADLKSATKNCIESVEKTHVTENEKKFVGQCNRFVLVRRACFAHVYGCMICLNSIMQLR